MSALLELIEVNVKPTYPVQPNGSKEVFTYDLPNAWEEGCGQMIPVILEGNEGEGYTATTPALAGCIAEGDTIEEALGDFELALKALLESYKFEDRSVPWKSVDELPLQEVAIRIFKVAVNG